MAGKLAVVVAIEDIKMCTVFWRWLGDASESGVVGVVVGWNSRHALRYVRSRASLIDYHSLAQSVSKIRDIG